MSTDIDRSATSDSDTAAQRDRARGALLGLAVGDALGTTLEFRSPGTFIPIDDMVGGGPFHLAPGQWTDDMSMALCLADSLLECGECDPADQMQRYVRWRDTGYRSSTGHCFDIGNTVGAALRRFERGGDPLAGSTDPFTAGNGSLMRLAPVPIFYTAAPEAGITSAELMSRTTHGAIYGQIAGAVFGESGIPAAWVEVLHDGDGIRRVADELLDGVAH